MRLSLVVGRSSGSRFFSSHPRGQWPEAEAARQQQQQQQRKEIDEGTVTTHWPSLAQNNGGRGGGNPVALRLITDESWLYTATDREMPAHWFGLPWWGFLWPGGYGVAQYVADNPSIAAGRRVVDFAAGCGVGGIVAAQAGAAEVICNDICPLACASSLVNAELNDVHTGGTLAGPRSCIRPGDLVMVGDAMYDITIAKLLLPWLRELASEGVEVLLGDPRRWVINEMSAAEQAATFELVADYSLPQSLADEHYGVRSTVVYRVLPAEEDKIYAK
eukprot:gene13972-432_t